MGRENRIGILVGGGPAPGINSVISSAVIEARQDEVEVVGIRDGFLWIMQGVDDHSTPLTIEDVSRIHFLGGSVLGTSRANPTRDASLLENAARSLARLAVDRLITIGGDDTAFSAMQLERQAAGRLRVVHVPKTIDNDLDLPPEIDTFGYQTARHLGVQIVKNLMVDATTTGRWYFVISMGRKAGHLALAIGKAAGATLTLIPEEFGEPLSLRTLVDTLAGAILKRRAGGRGDGVAVIAEGLGLNLDPGDLTADGDLERDAHGHVRLSELPLGDLLKRAVARRLADLQIEPPTIVAKNIGYELRCADPIPFDIDYTRDLGFCAARHLLEGGNAVMISMQGGHFVPVPFAGMLDPATGRARVRLVDIRSTRYAIARRYMIRLRREDFADPDAVDRLAEAAGVPASRFRDELEHVTRWEPPPLAPSLPQPDPDEAAS